MTKPPINRDTRLCISLSERPSNFGTRFHNRLYDLISLDYVYKAFATTDIVGAVAGIRALNVRGCAISMPFKEAVIPLLDGLAPSAAAIDSVNTIVNDDGVLTGHNTDYAAVRRLVEESGADPAQPILLRGSGGMAKAVAAAFHDAGFTQGTIVARNPATGPALAERYGYRWQAELGQTTAPVLVNVTPLGMAGSDEGALAFPPEEIEAASLIVDVVAMPTETPLLKAASGKPTITGAEIIVLQALEQFTLYTGVTPTEAQVVEAADWARAG
ncbi:shikimate 5-dehydrogenase [Sphingomonas sp. ID0503]|jgi:shikimate dehydrogenase|uniref:shikimate 5-dehydrogenase n=1 Tax=Sphingomonas sp. ID0503 TaxID=3399691 RepID=UPI003AFB3FFE